MSAIASSGGRIRTNLLENRYALVAAVARSAAAPAVSPARRAASAAARWQAVHVVTAHPAPGHGRGVPEHRRGGGRVVRERGRLLVALLGLADQVSG